MRKKKKQGRPATIDRETMEILYVRIDKRLSHFINWELDRKRKEHPGMSISKSDIVRDILFSVLVYQRIKERGVA